MADLRSFDHIKVTPAEEDTVIYAGVDSSRDAGGPAEDGSVPRAEEPARTTPDSRVDGREARRDARAAHDDLDAAPMPIAQKIVIIAAIVLIIGALVYYFVAMR